MPDHQSPHEQVPERFAAKRQQRVKQSQIYLLWVEVMLSYAVHAGHIRVSHLGNGLILLGTCTGHGQAAVRGAATAAVAGAGHHQETQGPHS